MFSLIEQPQPRRRYIGPSELEAGTWGDLDSGTTWVHLGVVKTLAASAYLPP